MSGTFVLLRRSAARTERRKRGRFTEPKQHHGVEEKRGRFTEPKQHHGVVMKMYHGNPRPADDGCIFSSNHCSQKTYVKRPHFLFSLVVQRVPVAAVGVVPVVRGQQRALFERFERQPRRSFLAAASAAPRCGWKSETPGLAGRAGGHDGDLATREQGAGAAAGVRDVGRCRFVLTRGYAVGGRTLQGRRFFRAGPRAGMVSWGASRCRNGGARERPFPRRAS